MRKLHLMFLAFTLSIVMLATTVAPAFASKPEEPNDNPPVAWVTWVGSNANSKEEAGAHNQSSVLVKQLADGTTVGHLQVHEFSSDIYTIWDIIDSYFVKDGDVKIAHVLAMAPGRPFYIWYQFKDYGEPAAGADTYRIFVWAGVAANPSPPPPTVYVPDGYPAWPPVWNNTLPPPRWFQVTIGEVPVVSANIQVHITDEYTP